MDTYPHLKTAPTTEADWFQALTDLARYLRTPEGCPWDREQTAHDFAKYALGEVEEYIEALELADTQQLDAQRDTDSPNPVQAGHCPEEYVEALSKTEATDDDNEHVAEEFGDALFTLLASAAAAEEQGLFKIQDALIAARQKMIRRHDHVFGENKATTPEQAVQAWEQAKAKEKAREGKTPSSRTPKASNTPPSHKHHQTNNQTDP